MHKLNGVIEHYKRHIGRATESNDNQKVNYHGPWKPQGRRSLPLKPVVIFTSRFVRRQ